MLSVRIRKNAFEFHTLILLALTPKHSNLVHILFQKQWIYLNAFTASLLRYWSPNQNIPRKNNLLWGF